MKRFGKTSLKRLDKVHPKLVILATAVLIKHPEYDISVLDGARTIEQQKENVRKGVSWTMNSRHLIQSDGYSHAIDIKPSTYSWDEPISKWKKFAEDVVEIARALNIDIKSGGLAWQKDWVHFELKA